MGELVRIQLIKPNLQKHFGEFVHVSLQKAIDLERRGLARIVPIVESPPPGAGSGIECRADYLTKDFASGHKKIRVAWIQDLSKIGGAELSNQCVINRAQECGFDISTITPTRMNVEAIKAADIAVLNNIFEFSTEQLQTILKTVIEYGIPFVKYDHDFRELKRTIFARSLFNRSALNVFISPAHLERYISVYGQPFRDKCAVFPLAIDTAFFKNDGADRIKDSVLVLNPGKQIKGINKYLTSPGALGKHFTISGGKLGNTTVRIQADFIGKIPYEKLPEMYNRHEEVLLLYDTPEPGCRIYFESRLCGCRPIANASIGHMSWKFTDDQLRDELERAPIRFWERVKQCVR